MTLPCALLLASQSCSRRNQRRGDASSTSLQVSIVFSDGCRNLASRLGKTASAKIDVTITMLQCETSEAARDLSAGNVMKAAIHTQAA